MAQDDKLTSDVEVKALESFEIKNESTGEVEAIIATLDVVDHDNEVITKDAIKDGSKVKMSSYGHDIMGGLFSGGGAIPVGKGAVFIEGNKAIFRGKVFMTTERGRETLSVLKEMGSDQEWSFGFRILGEEVPDEKWKKQGAERILTKLDVLEVSPVVIGAGIGTRTLAAKHADEAARKAADEAAAAQRVADEAAAVAGAAAELAKTEAEQKAAADAAEAEINRLVAEATEATRLADEAAAAETKRVAEEAASKARRVVDREEYERVQRSLRRMGV